jgi:hypothetical protein
MPQHSHQTSRPSTKSLPPSVAKDGELMQFAIKGSDEQWSKALVGKEISESGTVQIRDVREKRKGVDETDYEHEAKSEPMSKKSKTSKQKKKGTGKRK